VERSAAFFLLLREGIISGVMHRGGAEQKRFIAAALDTIAIER
jgi:hypothetical protein